MSIAEKYILIKELGDQKRRKFGRVFLIQKRGTEELFILKTISVRDNDPHICDRMRGEYKFSFSHYGLPEVVDYFENEDEILLVLKHKKGETLDVWWNKQPRKQRVKQLKRFVNGISPVLDKLREMDIVHADIKPTNILVDDSGEELKIHLIDFGLALKLNDNYERKVLFPLGFGAPELILNRMDCVGHTTDLYALGVTIWRLFTETLPLTHPNPSIFTNLQLVHPLPDHDKLPKGLYPILLKMTAKYAFKNAPNQLSSEEVGTGLQEGRSNRYQTIGEVASDLNKLSEGNWISRALFGSRGQN
jgi:eukaryotic-like serine/threonine-protein kinase